MAEEQRTDDPAGPGPRRPGLWVLAVSGAFLVVWWWLDRERVIRSDEARLGMGAAWSALLLIGVFLGYGPGRVPRRKSSGGETPRGASSSREAADGGSSSHRADAGPADHPEP